MAQFTDPRVGNDRRKRLLKILMEQHQQNAAASGSIPGIGRGVANHLSSHSPRSTSTQGSRIRGLIEQALGVGARGNGLDASPGVGLPVVNQWRDVVAPSPQPQGGPALPVTPDTPAGDGLVAGSGVLGGTVGGSTPGNYTPQEQSQIDSSKSIWQAVKQGNIVPVGNGVYIDLTTGSVLGVPIAPTGGAVRSGSQFRAV